MSLDPARIRAEFPALANLDNGVPRVYLDNPGGTQVAQRVIDRTVEYLVGYNANGGGVFRTSIETDAMLDEAHAAVADLLGAASWREIVFGQNMTTLTFAISRSLGRRFKPGDEIVVTRMDHDANISPWLLLAEDLGLTIRWLPFDLETFRYDLDVLASLLNQRTVLVAVNYASNALGTINPVNQIASMAHAVGALCYVDAVQYVPHGVTDVQALGCDFLACSAYKFFGPHQGMLWGREELLQDLPAYKVRPADNTLPIRHETGTLSHEGIAGTLGVVEYLETLGEGPSRRDRLIGAMTAIEQYERTLSAHLMNGLQSMKGVRTFGVTELEDRVPTYVVDVEGMSSRQAAAEMAKQNIFLWDGDYYAQEVIRALGFGERGGLLRIGATHYNTIQELDRTLEALEALIRKTAVT